MDGTTYLFAQNGNTFLYDWTAVSSSGGFLWTRTKDYPIIGDGQGDAVVQTPTLVDVYNSQNTLIASYDMASVLGVGSSGFQAVFVGNGAFYCAMGQTLDARLWPSAIGAAKLTMRGVVAWSNPATTNYDLTLVTTPLVANWTPPPPVKGAVTPNGTTILVGHAPTAAIDGNAIAGIDGGGKLLFSSLLPLEGNPSQVLLEADGGFLVGTDMPLQNTVTPIKGGLARCNSNGKLLWTVPIGVSSMGFDSAGNILGTGYGGAFKVSPSGSLLWTYGQSGGTASVVDSTDSLVLGPGFALTPNGVAKFPAALPRSTIKSPAWSA